MANKNSNNPNNNASWWQKIKNFFHLNNAEEDDESGSSGKGKPQGQSFRDPRLCKLGQLEGEQFVKNPETVIYNEVKQDPAAMAALKALTNGQIPVSEATALFEKVRSSEVALNALVNSELTPPDVKRKARAELEEIANERRRKLQAEPGFKPNTPKPGI